MSQNGDDDASYPVDVNDTYDDEDDSSSPSLNNRFPHPTTKKNDDDDDTHRKFMMHQQEESSNELLLAHHHHKATPGGQYKYEDDNEEEGYENRDFSTMLEQSNEDLIPNVGCMEVPIYLDLFGEQPPQDGINTIGKVQQVKMSFYTSIQPDISLSSTTDSKPSKKSNKTNNIKEEEAISTGKYKIQMGGQSLIQNKMGCGSGLLSLSYQNNTKLPNTTTKIQMETGDGMPQFSLQTTHHTKQHGGNNMSVLLSSSPSRISVSIPQPPGVMMMDPPYALTVSGGRSVWDDKWIANVRIGLLSQRLLGMEQAPLFHTASVSLVSNVPKHEKFPQLRASLTINGRGYYQDALRLNLSAHHDFSHTNKNQQRRPPQTRPTKRAAASSSNRRTGEVSMGMGSTTGLYCKAMTTRFLSRYSQIGVGVQHASSVGLSWLFSFQRGNVSFYIPVTISSIIHNNTSSAMMPWYSYPLKAMYLCVFSTIMDAAIADFVQNVPIQLGTPSNKNGTTKQLEQEEIYLSQTKAREAAMRQVKLMSKQAASKVKIQRSKGFKGLIILDAVYGLLEDRNDGDDGGRTTTLDATTQLQFWVSNSDSTLNLPDCSKSGMLGFYNVIMDTTTTASTNDGNENGDTNDGLYPLLIRMYNFFSTTSPKNGNNHTKNESTASSSSSSSRQQQTNVQLYVKYQIGNDENCSIYEITIEDEDALVLPNPNAVKIVPPPND